MAVDTATLFGELKRRRVFRALAGYGIAAFAVLQIIERRLLLSARNADRLRRQEESFRRAGVHASASSDVLSQLRAADVIVCAASLAAPALDLGDCRPAALICDAGYPKNLLSCRADARVFWGGMGQAPDAGRPTHCSTLSIPSPRRGWPTAVCSRRSPWRSKDGSNPTRKVAGTSRRSGSMRCGASLAATASRWRHSSVQQGSGAKAVGAHSTGASHLLRILDRA